MEREATSDNLPGALTLRSHMMAKMLASSTVRKLRKITGGMAVAALAIALLACSAEATATPIPTPAPTPMSTATAEPTPVPTPVLTPSIANTPVPVDKGTGLADYWKPPTHFYGEPVYGGTLRIGYEQPLEHANIWISGDIASVAYRVPTGAGLVMDDPYNPYAPVIPDLAKSWTVHADGGGVTFHFREGTKWQSGDLFACEDARFSLETMATGEGLSSESYLEWRLQDVVLQELACLDDMTLQVNLTGSPASLLQHLSDRKAVLFNKAWFQQGGEEVMYTDMNMGIGPFKWAEGQRVGADVQRFVKNPDYFIPELPYLDELTIHGILDDRVRQAAQLAHQTDWTWVYFRPVPTYDYATSGRYMNWGEYQAYVDHDQIMTVLRPTLASHRISFDVTQPPFDKVRVRQAIAMAIDRKAAQVELWGGLGVQGGFGYPPGSPWELPQDERCTVSGWCISEDIEATRAEARAILEGEGFDFRKTYKYFDEFGSSDQPTSGFLVNQLQLLGIKVEHPLLELIPCRPGNGCDPIKFDIWLESSTFRPGDSDAALLQFLRCDSQWDSETFGLCGDNIVTFLEQAQNTKDPKIRRDLIHRSELALMSKYNRIPIFWRQEAAAFWPEVRGYVHFPYRAGSFQKFMHMWIDPAHADDTGNAGQTTGVPGGL